MPWLDKVPAVVMAWYPGMVGGTPLGSMLFGDASFSGKLPVTWAKQWNDEPAFNSGTTTNFNYYTGYHYFDQNGVTPLFPFGAGLSYTTFQYENLQVPCSSVTDNGVVEIKADVTNSGTMAADEVTFLFISWQNSTIRHPSKELKGFIRETIPAGQTVEVTIPLRISDLTYFDATSNAWKTESGTVKIMVGGSSTNLPLTDTLTDSSERAAPTAVSPSRARRRAVVRDARRLEPRDVSLTRTENEISSHVPEGGRAGHVGVVVPCFLHSRVRSGRSASRAAAGPGAEHHAASSPSGEPDLGKQGPQSLGSVERSPPCRTRTFRCAAFRAARSRRRSRACSSLTTRRRESRCRVTSGSTRGTSTSRGGTRASKESSTCSSRGAWCSAFRRPGRTESISSRGRRSSSPRRTSRRRSRTRSTPTTSGSNSGSGSGGTSRLVATKPGRSTTSAWASTSTPSSGTARRTPSPAPRRSTASPLRSTAPRALARRPHTST